MKIEVLTSSLVVLHGFYRCTTGSKLYGTRAKEGDSPVPFCVTRSVKLIRVALLGIGALKGGMVHLRLNMRWETDSEQVP